MKKENIENFFFRILKKEKFFCLKKMVFEVLSKYQNKIGNKKISSTNFEYGEEKIFQKIPFDSENMRNFQETHQNPEVQ